ncbi:M24 family metallopeptidase [Christensenella sp. MSJ-20]|uniref:M24 family metallopeptidase n=1 Tax=Christensenella sp. MSJ-20 TaxID=2841518 RepID=UPI001C751F06|nr:M24 family metallopeptidase [Christensenella sp. MSJ-20]
MRTVVPLKKQIEIIDNTLAARIPAIIPGIMAEYGFDMWIILCREYNEDPIYPTMVPYLCLTARRLSCLVFTLEKGVFHAYHFGRPDSKIARLYEQAYTDITRDQLQELADFIQRKDPRKIGVNLSKLSGMSDGLSHQLYEDLCACLAPGYAERLASAYELSTHWIETRLPEELSRYYSVYALAMDICLEAYSRKVIIPGVTTTTEVEEWIAQEINRLGLTFWFSPHVDVQRKGIHKTGSTGLVIQQGDLLHYDVGIKYFGLCTDSQRMGYVLRDGEREVPEYLRTAFAKTCRFQDIVAEEHIAGRTGNDILRRCLDRAKAEGIQAALYNHPIGFFGHSAGTIVGLWDMQDGIGPMGDFPLHYNTCYALELNTESELAEWDGQRVRFSAEESVAFTQDGKLSYLFPGRETIIAI